jgi:Fe-S oxidoreductase
MHARYRRDGLPLRERLFSNVDLLGKIGCAMPSLMNWLLDFKPVRVALEQALGVSARRSAPRYAKERFDRWFAKRVATPSPCDFRAPQLGIPTRGPVILWDDTFVRYHEPHIGIAAVTVLEALGFEVSLAKNRRCCGRPAFSRGNLDAAAKLARHNIDLLSSLQIASPARTSTTPILFLEPSCWSMFVEDYRELKIENAAKIADRCFLFEQFVDDLIEREPGALPFQHLKTKIAIHPHCHAKSIINPAFMQRLAQRLPGSKAILLDTACCGMAGAFGALAEKYDLSVQVAQDLIEKLQNQGGETQIIASGTSCRHQITDLTNIRPKHMAEVLAQALL